jgi:Domain of unknown function (DUF3127)
LHSSTRKKVEKMDITGRLKVVMEEKVFPSGFNKREFVITTEEQYPNDISFELLKDKCALVNNFQPGDRVTVRFDIRGREWQGKYFNSLVAWKLDNANAGDAQSAAPSQHQAMPMATAAAPVMETYSGPVDDDLPF